jgi:3-methyladenine DNA glycosylase AlkD
MGRDAALAAGIEAELQRIGTKLRATKEKAYLKSELVHVGATVPQMRATVVAALESLEDLTRAEMLAATAAMWSKGVFELRMAAVEILLRKRKLLEAADLARIEQLLRESQTWALVDVLATHVAGDLVERFPGLGRTLDRWAKDQDFWIRRSAMLALLVPLREGGGDFARFGRYADTMLEEKEFFIRKAIGWILRETSKKQPQLVFDWLAPRAARASGLTLREGSRQLPAKLRAQLGR